MGGEAGEALCAEYTMSWQEVISFWFEESKPEQWFAKDEAFDAIIRDKFLDTHRMVVAGETSAWRATPEGRLAEIIALDQFSRNMFRGTPDAFLHDAQALILAEEAVKVGADQELDKGKRYFMYMPYMHSESADVHERALKLFESLGDPEYEIKHKEIVDRFSRYPHRNAILGRASTPEELDFIASNPGF